MFSSVSFVTFWQLISFAKKTGYSQICYEFGFVGDYSGAITVCHLEAQGLKFINTLKVSWQWKICQIPHKTHLQYKLEVDLVFLSKACLSSIHLKIKTQFEGAQW